MRRWRRFPWHTVWLLVLTSWTLGLVASLWVQAVTGDQWTFTFATYLPWEPWGDGVFLVLGTAYIIWRWWLLLRALWGRWR